MCGGKQQKRAKASFIINSSSEVISDCFTDTTLYTATTAVLLLLYALLYISSNTVPFKLIRETCLYTLSNKAIHCIS
jgi:hypothetical protein